MKRLSAVLAGACLSAPGFGGPASADPLVWALQAEQAEYRIGPGSDVGAWDFDAWIGRDNLKWVWRSEGEFAFEDDAFETLENQIRVATPISDFFDAVAGIRVDTPKGTDRIYGVVGVHGLAKQWFEIDADLFLAENPTFRFEAEYEALLTNWITFVPSLEIDVPLADDDDLHAAAFGPTIELGARLSYDLIGRAVAPYIGIHYERVVGESALLARRDGEDTGVAFAVIGVRFQY